MVTNRKTQFQLTVKAKFGPKEIVHLKKLKNTIFDRIGRSIDSEKSKSIEI